MELETSSFKVSTDDRVELRKITDRVEDAIDESDAGDGLVFVSTPHTTVALFTNEYEKRLTQDIIDFFGEYVPPEGGYLHDRHHVATETQPNAHAHIITSMVHTPVLALLQDGTLQLGQWEDVLFFDLDGPSTRTVRVTILE
ncbi:secondary thiamine-phosphate synthase enzyme YjbQ [Natrarchaeobius chitinivorans]|uniref:YjbQ family protein n=1 Tax=Natrarchaeobius chitinivorans TaxID=1679083 RepID=A0A3N6LTV2_NATCH|nr:secondary thiamine-phosphate synthase enzyme YjbQ [Natrarchaeobius chitinivorans]RQG93573.1 YjbQ family protein [Natrarchaeobius chitinivorans]